MFIIANSAIDIESRFYRYLRLIHDRKTAAGLYGIFREKSGFPERANIIVDENGKIAFVKIYEIKQFPDIDEIINLIKKLQLSE